MKIIHKKKHYSEKFIEQACIDSWIYSVASHLFFSFLAIFWISQVQCLIHDSLSIFSYAQSTVPDSLLFYIQDINSFINLR